MRSIIKKIFSGQESSLAGTALVKPKKKCYICGNTFERFNKFDIGMDQMPLWFEKLDWVGSDLENFACPYCGCNDRERHLFLYFDRLGFWERMVNKRVIHFAPEPQLGEKIRQLPPALYVKADLYPQDDTTQKIDITAIPYDNETFDVLICNHVLEHVTDYRKALSEVHRVLSKGGVAVLQTPYSKLLHKNFEDDGIDTDELRLIYYGQADHVRFFSGQQLFKSIEEAGFELNLVQHHTVASAEDAILYGMNANEELVYVVKAG